MMQWTLTLPRASKKQPAPAKQRKTNCRKRPCGLARGTWQPHQLGRRKRRSCRRQQRKSRTRKRWRKRMLRRREKREVTIMTG
jgi:hypothetical protein